MKLKLFAITALLLIAGIPSPAIGRHFVKLNWVAPTTYFESGGKGLSTNVVLNVYKSSDGTHFTPIATDIALSNIQFIDNFVIPDQTYWYYVTAYDTQYSTESAASNIVSFLVP